jgi:hypothetical protein
VCPKRVVLELPSPSCLAVACEMDGCRCQFNGPHYAGKRRRHKVDSADCCNAAAAWRRGHLQSLALHSGLPVPSVTLHHISCIHLLISCCCCTFFDRMLLSCQIVMSANKEAVLSEREDAARWGQTVVTSYSGGLWQWPCQSRECSCNMQPGQRPPQRWCSTAAPQALGNWQLQPPMFCTMCRPHSLYGLRRFPH